MKSHEFKGKLGGRSRPLLEEKKSPLSGEKKRVGTSVKVFIINKQTICGCIYFF